jgi:hypothetical protein
MLVAAVMVAALLVPNAPLWAQNAGPIAVLAVEPMDQLMEDMSYLTEAAGQGEAVADMKKALQEGTEGMDTTRPMGVLVTADGDELATVAFLPITDLAKMMEAGEATDLFESEDLGDGMYKLSRPLMEPMMLKAAGNWAFVAQKAEQLDNLPADPPALLKGLEKTYAVALRIYLQNIPPALREEGERLIREGMSTGLEPLPGETDDAYAARKKMATGQVEQLMSLVDEADQVTIGWDVDVEGKQTYIDIELKALPGTSLAEQLALQADATSQHSGFVRDDAAMFVHFAQKLVESDIEQMTSWLQATRDNAVKEIAAEGLDADQADAAKKVMESVFDALDATIKGGKLDGGAVVLLKADSFFFAAGGQVADGKKIEQGLRTLAELSKDEPDFPEINWDAEEHAGVTFHTMSIPVPDPDSREVLGESIDVVLGTSDTSFYIAAGTDALTQLKSIIDASAANGAQTVPPAQISVAATPILQFAGQFAPPVGLLAAVVGQSGGKDHVKIVNKIIENGSITRITVEEGMLKAIGLAGAMLMEAMQGGSEDDGTEPEFF